MRNRVWWASGIAAVGVKREFCGSECLSLLTYCHTVVTLIAKTHKTNSFVLEHKIARTVENIDWETCPQKYADILDQFVVLIQNSRGFLWIWFRHLTGVDRIRSNAVRCPSSLAWWFTTTTFSCIYTKMLEIIAVKIEIIACLLRPNIIVRNHQQRQLTHESRPPVRL